MNPSHDTLYLHDSEVLALQADSARGLLSVALSAAFVRREPGGQTGYLRGVVLSMTGTHWHESLPVGGGRITNGHVRLSDGTRFTRLALPTRLGPVEIELEFGHGLVLNARAETLDIDNGDGGFTLSLAC